MAKKQASLNQFFAVPPPPQKRRRAEEPRRIFSEKWLEEVPWLVTDENRTEMWCKVCRANPTLADPASLYYQGTKNFSHPAFDKHDQSKEHRRALGALTGEIAEQRPVSDGPMDKWQDRLTQAQHQALTNMFLCAFHNAKHARPLQAYEQDIPLLKRYVYPTLRMWLSILFVWCFILIIMLHHNSTLIHSFVPSFIHSGSELMLERHITRGKEDPV